MLKVKKSNFSAQLTAANDQAQKKLEGILTKEQWALYQELKSDAQMQKDEYLRNNPNYKFSTMEQEMDF